MRHVVVTGGSGGIGSAVVQSFLAEGDHVVNLDLREATEHELGVGRLDTVRVDLSDAPAVRGAFSHIDELLDGQSPDILVCCASISQLHHFLEVEDDDLDRIVAVNIRGTFIACQEVGRRMRTAGNGGHIVVITSICDTVAWAGEPVYTITKGAQWSLVQTLAVELAHDGIAVNAVSPFAIEVPSGGMAPTRDATGARRQMLQRTPAGRFGKPAEVAEAVTFLSESTWITGQRIVVDGGFLATGFAYERPRSPALDGHTALFSSND